MTRWGNRSFWGTWWSGWWIIIETDGIFYTNVSPVHSSSLSSVILLILYCSSSCCPINSWTNFLFINYLLSYQATSGYKNHVSLISNTMLFWRNWPHFDKSSTNIISLICLARNGLRLQCNITLRNHFLQNKGTAKRGISPRLKNIPWPWPLTYDLENNNISWRSISPI